jgi:tetratricopeptide (TPR) repeat protein
MLAIDLARPLGNSKMLVTALGNLAAIYGYVMDDVPKGLASISEAIEIAEKYDYKDSKCGLYSIKGGLCGLQNDYKLAIGYYLTAGRLAQATNNIPAQAEAYANVADAYLHKGMPVKAEEYARKALEMNATSQLESVNADASISLARACILQQKYAEALPYAEPFLQHPEPSTRQKVLIACVAAAKGAHLRDKARRYKAELDAITIELQNEEELKEDILRIERQHGLRLFARRKE